MYLQGSPLIYIVGVGSCQAAGGPAGKGLGQGQSTPSLPFFLIYFVIFECLLWICTSLCRYLWRLERVYNTLEPGLQAPVSCLMWVPGPEPRSSATAVRT